MPILCLLPTYVTICKLGPLSVAIGCLVFELKMVHSSFHQLKVLRPPRRLGSLKPLFQINLYHRMLHQRSYVHQSLQSDTPECCELNFLLHIVLSPNAWLTSKSIFRKTLFQIFAVYEGCYIRGLRSEPSCCEHNIFLVYIGNIVLSPKIRYGIRFQSSINAGY